MWWITAIVMGLIGVLAVIGLACCAVCCRGGSVRKQDASEVPLSYRIAGRRGRVSDPSMGEHTCAH